MKVSKQQLATLGLMAAVGLAANAEAQNFANQQVLIDGGTIDTVNGTFTDSNPGDSDALFTIDQSITLSADKWYDLQSRAVVLPGATLTIEPGTVFASSNNPNGASGSLIIASGAQIIAEGTKDAPIIFTSGDDLANWDNDNTHPTGKDPRNRGQWRPGVFEWGSIAVLGDARISDTRQNTSNGTAFDQSKTAPIEGLPNLSGGINFYGGLNDDDDSGVFTYVSLSYGGDDFDPANASELNGMSIGGVGRGTTFHHVEILNNIADGIDKKVARQLDTMVRLIEPALLMVMGSAILFVIVALLLPVFEMSTTMG